MFRHSPTRVALDWHQSRRAQGLPTISMLVGPSALGLRAWRRWCAPQRRALAAPDLTSAAADWLACQPDLTSRVLDWLCSQTHAVRLDPARMTPFDLDLIWNGLPGAKSDAASQMAYRVLDAAIRTQPLDIPRTIRELGEVTVVAGLCGVMPESSWPAFVLLNAETPDPEAFVLRALHDLERIAGIVPRLLLGLCVSTYAFDAIAALPMRAAALAREGEIRLSRVSADELTDRLRTAGVPEPLPTVTIERLTAAGLAEDVADAFVTAATAVSRDASEADDPHRSASEWFLFEQLESMVETAGVFVPNRALEFLHGTHAAEADLVAPTLKLAIEVDGGYYHLNAEQYRRDRRKDHAYQRHGYWVLRFLAEDVVVDLEAILNTILEAVANRRSSTSSEVPHRA